MLRFFLALGSALLGVATATAAPKLDPPPPFISAYEPTTVDERGLWMLTDEAERAIRDAPDVIRDPALTGYVRAILCRTVGRDRCAATRIYVIHSAMVNASMMPNGTMVVYTGLLLRMHSEAMLAAILGHEFAHFELRHTLAGFKNRRTTTDIISWLGVLAPQQSGTLRSDLYGLQFAFARDQETAADLLGLRYMKASGYRPDCAAQVWQDMMAEADAAALGRKRAAVHRYNAGFFDTHPTSLTRATYLRAAAGEDADRGDDGAAAYTAAMARWRGTFLRDQLKLNDFGGSEYLLGQLAESHWSGDLLFARGELYRERGNPRDLVSAATFYQQAIEAGYADPLAWRGLGLALLRSQQPAAGRAALGTYLQRAPTASDGAAMRMLIDQGETP